MSHTIYSLIRGDSWLQCATTKLGEDIVLRIRPVLFEKINVDEIEIGKINKLDDGILWMIKIDVVNFSKKPLEAYFIRDNIKLRDQDDYIFDAMSDTYLTYSSSFAENNGFKRFASFSGTPSLPCKMKTGGSLSFLLPHEEKAEYFLSIKDGNIDLL
jgi:hypothetical protein